MRWKVVVCAGLIAPLTGCNLAYYAGHNLVNEPISRYDEHKLDARLRAEAESCWQEICRQYPGRTFTAEFAEGFVEGFIDYLDSGGSPQPPAVPPVRYRRSQYLTPQGHARATDYLTGFKYGAEIACTTGRRQYLTVPVVLPEPRPEPPLSVIRVPSAEPASVPTTPLPSPRPAEPGKPLPSSTDLKSLLPPVDAPKVPISTAITSGVTFAVDLDPHRNAPGVIAPVVDRPAALPPVDAPPPPLPTGGGL